MQTQTTRQFLPIFACHMTCRRWSNHTFIFWTRDRCGGVAYSIHPGFSSHADHWQQLSTADHSAIVHCSLFPQSWFSSGNWNVEFFIPSIFQELFRVVLPNICRRRIIILYQELFFLELIMLNVECASTPVHWHPCYLLNGEWLLAYIILWPRIRILDVRCGLLEMSQNYLSCILSNEYIHSCVFLDGMEAMVSMLAPCLP